MPTESFDIHLARTGEVTCRNHARLGYERLTRGVYGRVPLAGGWDEYQVRSRRFFAMVHAVIAAYPNRDIALYGPTALQVLGVALPICFEDWDNCHIIVPRGTYQPVRRGVIVHRANAGLTIWGHVGGLPVLHPVDHWAQLRGGTINNLVEVGDGLMRRRKPLLTLEAVNRRIAQLAGVPGVGRLRQAARLIVPGTDSLYETRTRLTLIDAGLPCPLVNLPVFVHSVGRTYHLDMGYEEEKVGVEFDGLVHVGDDRQQEIDAARLRDLADEGWFVVRVTAKQLAHPEDFTRPIERALVMRHGLSSR